MKERSRFLIGLAASASIGIAAGLGICNLADAYVESNQKFEAVQYGSTAGVIKEIEALQKVAPYEVVPSSAVATKKTVSDPAGLTFTDEESQMLLKLAMAEAEDQGVIGKALVIRVVKNRMDSEAFPNSIQDVIFEPKQFSPVWDGRYDEAVPDAECYEALEMVLNYWDGSNGATYFEAEWSEGTWHKDNLTELFTYGTVAFYK